MSLERSEKLLGSYRLEDVLGEGTMGRVYVATHTKLGRKVAIKVLRSEYADNPQAIRRFFAEARAVNKIAHPNIIEITDFFEHPGQDNYYVMELLEGVSLKVLLGAGGVMPLDRSIGIMSQLADAMAAVHRARIVHRDIKPDNILLIERGGKADFVKLCDFGVAKVINPGPNEVSIHSTQQGAILGTPEYMSPEQASGKSVDETSDVYSFGVTLYELVTGRLPLHAADFGEMVVALRQTDPPRPASLPGLPHVVPASLDELIMHCLAKNPEVRPTIEQVAKRLDQIAEQENWIVYELEAKPSARMSGQFPSSPNIPTSGSHPILPTPAPYLPTPIPGSMQMPAAPPRTNWRPFIIGGVALALGAVIAIVLGTRGGKPDARAGIKAKIKAELVIADDRLSTGRFVGAGGDEALDHLLAARALDPSDPDVKQRLDALAQKFNELADQAIAAGSLAEAAAQLQTVLLANPDDQAAKAKMADVEKRMLEQEQKAPQGAPKPPPKRHK